MEEAIEFLQRELLNAIHEYVINNDVDFDPELATQYIHNTGRDRLLQIMETAKRDHQEAKDALFPPSMLKTILSVSLKHGLVEYAKKIVEHSKIQKS